MAPSDGRYLFQVDQGHVRIGRFGERLEQMGSDAGQEVTTPPRRQKGHRFLGQLGEVIVSGLHIAETRSRPGPSEEIPGRDWGRE